MVNLTPAQANFRQKAFLAALTGLMAREERIVVDGSGNIMFSELKIKLAWEIADMSLKDSGIV